MSGELAGKRALVTGASRGIGRAVALAYAAAGAEVLATARDEPALTTLAEEIAAAGGRARVAALDLAAPGAIERIVAAVEARGPSLDVLVVNAGQLGVVASLEEYPPALFEQVMRINLTVPFLLVHALMPHLRRAPAASIVLVTSGLGRRGRAGWGAYAISKFGLEGLAEVLADELAGSTVRSNLVSPGPTRTAMRAAAFPDEDPATLPAPEDLVPVFVHLASDAAKGTNGQRLEARAWRSR